MSTSEGPNRCVGGEEEVMTDGAVSFQTLLPACMACPQTKGHTCVAGHAVKVVKAKAPTHAAQVAKWTMVNGFTEDTAGLPFKIIQ